MRLIWVRVITDNDGYDIPTLASFECKGDDWELVPLFESREEVELANWDEIVPKCFSQWAAVRFGLDEPEPVDTSNPPETVYVLSVRDKDGYYIPIMAATDEGWLPELYQKWQEFERKIKNIDHWDIGAWFITPVDFVLEEGETVVADAC
jgi:hypothetical protein